MSLHPADLHHVMADVDPPAAADCEPWFEAVESEVRLDWRRIVRDVALVIVPVLIIIVGALAIGAGS